MESETTDTAVLMIHLLLDADESNRLLFGLNCIPHKVIC